MKFDGTNWVNVGPSNFTTDFDVCNSSTVDTSGNPYVAYQGYSAGLTVMKFNGTSWNSIRSTGFNVGGGNRNFNIAVTPSGILYVAFGDNKSGYYGYSTVITYNGSNWVTVGPEGFSGASVNSTSMALDATGIPYVAWESSDSYNTATVMKFNGSSWAAVGSPGFVNYVGEINIALSSTGTPYVVFSDENFNQNSKATVMKFDGSKWVYVGSPDFRQGEADIPTIAIDSSGTPFVAYRDQSNESKITVMKFDGTNWTVVASDISAGSASSMGMALDASGKPYVGVEDGGNSDKASVMKLFP
jgi:hypothetical protein